MILFLFLRNWLFLLLLFVVNRVLPPPMTCRINSISRGSSFLLQILLSNYKANNYKANNHDANNNKANRPLLVQVLICGSIERRHFPHSGNSTDCGRPVYDDDDDDHDDDDHDDFGAGHSDDGDEED